jgi:demethylmenaquinone methyltransferase/2-methoxy-6-polyprenyl-1,4-benzoquinol methylase
MTNEYYEQGARRAARVDDLFAKIAPRYDLINDLQSFGLHRWWKHWLITLAGPNSHIRALDLCCGTGDVALALARKGADVTGLDFSRAMLSIAEQRGAKTEAASGAKAPRFLLGDAQEIPFAENTFETVTVSYGLRNLADWTLGMREMWRVAKSGGRLLVLDFGKPDNAAWRTLYFTYLRGVVPLFGRVFCGDAHAYAYILESLRHYPAQLGVAAEMRRLGCRDVRIVQFLGGVMSINIGVKP